MVENNSFSDQLASVTAPAADTEHTRALQALQSELEYHRKAVGNGTYLDSAVSLFYDGGRNESQHQLELALQNEKDNPNFLTRENVTKLVNDDQSIVSKNGLVDTTVGLVGTALTYLGGSKGKLIANVLVALDTAHPNDSLPQQALEAVEGVGLGMFANYAFGKGAAMKNPFIGATMQVGAYPLVSHLGRIQWPNQGAGDRPDVDQIYTAPIPETTYAPYSNLQPSNGGEWTQFDFLKK